MDPQACLRRWREAISAGDMEEASEACSDLRRWIRMGGFPPKGLTKKEKTALGLPVVTRKPKRNSSLISNSQLPNPTRHFPKTSRGRPPVNRKWQVELFGTQDQGKIGSKTLSTNKDAAYDSARKMIGKRHGKHTIHRVVLTGPK